MNIHDWSKGTIGDVVASIRAGYSATGEDRPAKGDEVGVLKTGAVLGGSLRPQENKAVLEQTQKLRVPLRKNTVLVGRKNSEDMVGSSVHVDLDIPHLHLPDLIWELTPTPDSDSRWLAYALQNSPMLRRIRWTATGTQATMKNLNRERFLSLPLLIPPKKEQQQIATVLDSWDRAAARTRHQRRHVQFRYARIAETIADSASVSRPLAETTRELTTRNDDLKIGRQHVMGVSNKHGLVPMREQTIARDLARYHVLPPRAFAYNPMRINVGSIAMSRLDHDVVVSPDYVLFVCERELLPEYLDHVLETSRWRHAVSAGSSGSVRTRTYYADLARIRIPVPPLGEQERMVTVLDAMRDEATLLGRKIELLGQQKRGLAQRLLSGELRVNDRTEGMSPT